MSSQPPANNTPGPNSPLIHDHPSPSTSTMGDPRPAGSSSNARTKRTKRDSQKKREAKGVDSENAPPRKKLAVAPSSATPSSQLSMLRPVLLADPRSSDAIPPKPRQMNFVYTRRSDVLNKSWEFYEVVEKLSNKTGFRYSYAIADQSFPHIRYRQTDVAPFHARFSYEDSPTAIAFTKDALAVSTNEPWHSARANVCAREGTYYYEARVISSAVRNAESMARTAPGASRAHVRLGFMRREAELDVNVGVDCYGYGIRDVNGEVINRMRCESFFPKDEAINEGDVIGLLITLPSLALHKKVAEGTYDPNVDGDGTALENDHSAAPVPMNLIRDRIPFHLKSDFLYQQSNIFPSKHLRDYAFNLKETPTYGRPSPFNSEDPSLRTLPGSRIMVYKNGVKMGTPFTDLYAFLPPASRLTQASNNLGTGERENADDGMIGYFPAVSCYCGGAVECRFEGPWWVGPPADVENVKSFGERYTDQIAEDILADIVDEIEAESMGWIVDEAVASRGYVSTPAQDTLAMTPDLPALGTGASNGVVTTNGATDNAGYIQTDGSRIDRETGGPMDVEMT